MTWPRVSTKGSADRAFVEIQSVEVLPSKATTTVFLDHNPSVILHNYQILSLKAVHSSSSHLCCTRSLTSARATNPLEWNRMFRCRVCAAFGALPNWSIWTAAAIGRCRRESLARQLHERDARDELVRSYVLDAGGLDKLGQAALHQELTSDGLGSHEAA
eukprot:TRINITY_DN7872_c0_g1_i2.p1 TRINITY_DN7872_c0_g1~~TRINITY_DN7872_c0_g1_i2.p1  ORF type:complete len:160 (-),score=4.60 TRINITY_DN7872_c0_g1_i2:139-618(-)